MLTMLILVHQRLKCVKNITSNDSAAADSAVIEGGGLVGHNDVSQEHTAFLPKGHVE